MTAELPVDVATLQRLAITPPTEFVAARTALVKERRAAKDREAATAIGALRRPSVVDWVLNVVADDDPALVGAFADAAVTVADAQAAAIEGRDGPDIRAAVRDLREHSAQVLAAARRTVAGSGRAADSQNAELTARLAEVAASTGALGRLRAGVLGLVPVEAPADDDPFAGLALPATRPARRAPAAASRPAAPAAATKADAGGPSPAERAAARRTARAAVTAAEREEKAAAKAHAAAGRAANAAREAVDEARARLAAAESRLADADADAVTAAEALASAQAATAAAREQLDAAD